MSSLEPTQSGGAPSTSLAWRAVLLWALVFVVARSILVLSIGDVFFYGEECAKGTAAKAMLDRLPVEHWRLAYHYYEGGGFATSHLDALAFALIGPSLLALKIVALGFGVAILALGMRFAGRWFGVPSAHLFAALYVFAPATIQKLSLLDLGIHYQALLFTLGVLHFALVLTECPSASRRHAFAFGLCAGFGLFFSFQCAIPIAIAALWILARRRSIVASRDGGLIALGAIVGAAPLLWMAAHVGSAVFDIHGSSLVSENDGAPSKSLAFAELADSLFSGRSARDWIALAVLPLIASIGAWVAVARGGAARRAMGLVLAFGIAYAIAYAVSPFTIGDLYHYFRLNRLCPLWFVAVLAASAAIGNASRGAARIVLAVLALAVCGDGLVDLEVERNRGVDASLADNFHLLATTKGYEFRDYVGKFTHHLDGGEEWKLKVLLGFRESSRELLLPSICEQLFEDPQVDLDRRAALLARNVGGEWRVGLAGWGVLLRRRMGGTIVERVKSLESFPADWRERLAEAIGRAGSSVAPTEDRVRGELAQLRGNSLPDAFWRGFGWRLYATHGDRESATRYFDALPPPLWASRDRARAFVANEDPHVAQLVLEGYDAARAANTLP